MRSQRWGHSTKMEFNKPAPRLDTICSAATIMITHLWHSVNEVRVCGLKIRREYEVRDLSHNMRPGLEVRGVSDRGS